MLMLEDLSFLQSWASLQDQMEGLTQDDAKMERTSNLLVYSTKPCV